MQLLSYTIYHDLMRLHGILTYQPYTRSMPVEQTNNKRKDSSQLETTYKFSSSYTTLQELKLRSEKFAIVLSSLNIHGLKVSQMTLVLFLLMSICLWNSVRARSFLGQSVSEL